MIPRYTLPEMADLWNDETKFSYWLKVELAVLYARMKLGQITEDCYQTIEKNANFTLARIQELEATYDHDMIAFVETVRELLRQKGVRTEWADEFHRYLTSYDIEDPALMLRLLKAGELILKEIDSLKEALLWQAKENQWTLMIARTHGQYAEPTTFGQLLLVYAEQINRASKRIKFAMENDLAFGKISGAVGTYAGLNPKIEEIACWKLGLKPAKIATQILQRDRHASFLAAIAIAGASIEQMCATFWEMMRSEIGELQEPRKEKQRGSSAMPQKKNPILTERLIGMARKLRANLLPAIENIATRDHREITQSSVERMIFPDSTTLLHYMANKATKLVKGLVIFPERMAENLKNTFGTWAGQRVRYALVEAGIDDSTTYTLIQQASSEAIRTKTHLMTILKKMPISETDSRTIADILPENKLLSLFDEKTYIQEGIKTIFSRFTL